MKTRSEISKLSGEYLFTEIGRIIRSRKDVINLSIGDVKLPLPSCVSEAGVKAAEELSRSETFRGYPPESGYDFLKAAIKSYYARRNVSVEEAEIFVSDGIKSDMNLFLQLFGRCKVLLPTPTYPAYVEQNTILGNRIEFYTSPVDVPCDLIVICSPDNPTGKTADRATLEEWIRLARKNGSLILFDAAYEAFVSDGIRSIFELKGARECAVEFCSLSKTAGFTGVRCGYTVVPKECGLNAPFLRLKSCLTNGVSYITQRMAECALTSGLDAITANIAYYKRNAELFMSALSGSVFSGGKNSPYIWLKTGDSMTEFYKLLDFYGIGVTPGAGFGSSGSDFVRINCFCSFSDALKSASALKQYVINK